MIFVTRGSAGNHNCIRAFPGRDASTSEPSKAAVQTSVNQQPVANWDVVGWSWESLELEVGRTEHLEQANGGLILSSGVLLGALE